MPGIDHKENFIDTISCGCTRQIFHTPVTFDCNHALERDAALEWLTQECSCPKCRKPITYYKPDLNLKNFIEDYLILSPNDRKLQYQPLRPENKIEWNKPCYIAKQGQNQNSNPNYAKTAAVVAGIFLIAAAALKALMLVGSSALLVGLISSILPFLTLTLLGIGGMIMFGLIVHYACKYGIFDHYPPYPIGGFHPYPIHFRPTRY